MLEELWFEYSEIQDKAYSMSPFCRWTPSKWKLSTLSSSLIKYGFQLGPRESTEQMMSCSLIHVITIQYLLPSRTTTAVPNPEESTWHMEWTNCTFTPDKRPFHIRLCVRNPESNFITQRKLILGYFMWCHTPKLGRHIKVSSLESQWNGIERWALLLW